jgi:hypothetical protein
MRPAPTLLLALLTLPAMAQIGRKELRTDTGLVVLHFHATGEASTKEWWDVNGHWGRSWAYARDGKVIFEGQTRRVAGQASVRFSYHPNVAVSKVETSDAPDGGIQWYKSTTTFDAEGTRTGFTEYGRDNDGPIPRVTVQPREPYRPTESPHKEPDVAICQRMFTNEVFLVNATRQAGKAKVKVMRPSPALKDSEHTLAPGDTVRLGSYSVGERFAAPETELTVDVRRMLRNRKRPAAQGQVRTTEVVVVGDEHRRYYLVVRSWGK